MNIFFNTDEKRWESNQYFSPKGKLIVATIPSVKTLNSVASIITEQKQDGQNYIMLRQRMMDTLDKPEQHEQYSKAMDKLLSKAKRQQHQKFNLGKGKQVKFRIVDYGKDTTVLEPADERNKKILIKKLGYDM